MQTSPKTSRRAQARGVATLALLALACVAVALLAGQPRAARAATGAHIDTLSFTQDVTPASARFLDDAIATAERDGATLLLITVDTPGGDIASMEDMVQHELASTIPIVTYVAPQGAHAGSAGTFITLAAPVAAMAPNTRIGAASPVSSSGQDITPTLDRKIKNDLEALLRRIQTTFNRNPDLAVSTVESAIAYDDQDAISKHLVNLGAATQADLLQQLDGMTITLATGSVVTLHTAGLATEAIQPSLANQLESVFLDPNLLFILFIVAAICIYLELSHPGAIVPGTIGAITLVVFLFGAGTLDPNWTGLVLMLLAIVLLAVDVRVPTHGVLTLGALICLVVGSLIFFDSHTAEGQPGVSPLLIGGAAAGVGLVSLIVISYVIRSQHWKITTGVRGLIGQTATVLDPLVPEGRVRVLGEDWAARLGKGDATALDSVAADALVRVTGRDGLTLIVEPLQR
ncbi:MAG: nodulation protein NfeD [Ktedonobacterales bacterium]